MIEIYKEIYSKIDNLLQILACDISLPKDYIYKIYSEEAVDLLFSTGLVESHFKTAVQYGYKKTDTSNFAISYFQIEKNTISDLYNNYLTYRPDLFLYIERFRNPTLDIYQDIINNFTLALLITRIQYLRVPEKLPSITSSDFKNYCQQIARYHKKYWNTNFGKADEQANAIEIYEVLGSVKQ